MFSKIKELKQNNNDIYFMEILSNKIIVNDNYFGVLVFDANLDLLKRIKIFNDIIIYSCFVNNKNEILLFCPDNECLVYINIVNYEYKVIYLKDGLENIIFSTLYVWNKNVLILATDIGQFYNISLNNETIQEINFKEIMNKYPYTHKFYDELTNYKIIKTFTL